MFQPHRWRLLDELNHCVRIRELELAVPTAMPLLRSRTPRVMTQVGRAVLSTSTALFVVVRRLPAVPDGLRRAATPETA